MKKTKESTDPWALLEAKESKYPWGFVVKTRGEIVLMYECDTREKAKEVMETFYGQFIAGDPLITIRSKDDEDYCFNPTHVTWFGIRRLHQASSDMPVWPGLRD